MRVYEIWIQGAIFKIKADEIVFKDTFSQETTKEPLVFFLEKRLVGIFKIWDAVIDITDKGIKDCM